MKSIYPITKTEAFILHTTPSGETDRYVTFLTPDYGVVDVFARSIRKEEAKMRTVAIPYHYVTVSFVNGKRYILKDIRTKDPLLSIWGDASRYTAYVSLLREVRTLLPVTEHVDADVFHIVRDAMETIQHCPSAQIDDVGLLAKATLLSVLGYVDNEHIAKTSYKEMVQGKAISSAQRETLETCIADALRHR